MKETKITELTQINQTLTVKITTYEEEISQLRISIRQLESNLTALQDAYEGLLKHSQYTI